MNPSSGSGDNGRKPLGRTDSQTDGRIRSTATILGVLHGRVIIMVDIKYDQNPSSFFRDMGPDGRTNCKMDGRPNGQTPFHSPPPQLKSWAGDNYVIIPREVSNYNSWKLTLECTCTVIQSFKPPCYII